MRSTGSAAVVVNAEVLDHHPGLGEAAEHLDGEELVADAAVERLHERVLPRRAGLDERGAGPAEATPVPQGVGGRLRPVVTAHELRVGAALTHDPVEHVDHAIPSIRRSAPIASASRVNSSTT
jgi:hypothetical protein